MVALGLLGLLLLQVCHASENNGPPCPGPGPDPGHPVPSCNYWCEGENADWVNTYYVNGTRCNFGDGEGVCAQLPEASGCYHKDDEAVQVFINGTTTTTRQPIKTKGPKRTKKPKKPKKTKKPKSTKPTKGPSKKTKKSKRSKTSTTAATEPQW